VSWLKGGALAAFAAGLIAARRRPVKRYQVELLARVEELRLERDFIRTVVDSAPAFFCVLDAEGRIERFNDTLAETSGIADDDRVRGSRFWDVFVDDPDATEVERAIMDRIEGEHEHHWGGHIVAWRLTPLPGGKVLVSGTDVTERRRMENELRASRARIVEAGDAERKRLERNLHDGAQQRLVSLSLALRLAQSKLDADPGAAREILSGSAVELGLALEELRELARGLHPAILTDRGLEAALDGLATRSPVPVELAVALDERLPDSVEAALFYVAAEALTNVAKYADANVAQLRIAVVDGRAVVEVEDDGVGGADPAAGWGIRGLIDRVEALDGTLYVHDAPARGTLVRAEIPVSRTRAPAAVV
jgi:PAS domain S-box-containing protein